MLAGGVGMEDLEDSRADREEQTLQMVLVPEGVKVAGLRQAACPMESRFVAAGVTARQASELEPAGASTGIRY